MDAGDERGNVHGKHRFHRVVKNGSIINLTISIIWTIIIVLPIEPFSILLRIIVGGGPGVWFLLAYLLHLIVGYGGFTCLSFLYYLIEEKWEVELNNKLIMAGFYLLFIGVNITLITLAAAGAVGGYYLNIIHAPVEDVRSILEPMVNPIRLLSLITIVGALILLIPVYKTFARK
ncbi:MAG: cbb3-type cytochrome c oxidase subunit I [Thaumarchaeota archaeon]|jgi:hypothetical protein|nr:cbb3-type cytochrome c oxidase subunit I [Candidatus Geocrenenecus arthurdayi]